MVHITTPYVSSESTRPEYIYIYTHTYIYIFNELSDIYFQDDTAATEAPENEKKKNTNATTGVTDTVVEISRVWTRFWYRQSGKKKRKPMQGWQHQLEMGRRRRFGGNTQAEMRRDASKPKGFGEAKEQSGLNDPMPCLMHHGHACYEYASCVMGHTSSMFMSWPSDGISGASDTLPVGRPTRT